MIENNKFFFWLGVCIYITYQIKECVYIIKKHVCIYKYVCVRLVLIDILVLQLGPPKQIFLALPYTPFIIYIKRGKKNILKYLNSID